MRMENKQLPSSQEEGSQQQKQQGGSVENGRQGKLSPGTVTEFYSTGIPGPWLRREESCKLQSTARHSDSYMQSQHSGGRVSQLLFSVLKQLKEGGIYFGSGFQNKAPHGRKQEWEVTVTFNIQGSARQKDASLSSLLFSTHSRTPAHSVLPPTLHQLIYSRNPDTYP